MKKMLVLFLSFVIILTNFGFQSKQIVNNNDKVAVRLIIIYENRNTGYTEEILVPAKPYDLYAYEPSYGIVYYCYHYNDYVYGYHDIVSVGNPH